MFNLFRKNDSEDIKLIKKELKKKNIKASSKQIQRIYDERMDEMKKQEEKRRNRKPRII